MMLKKNNFFSLILVFVFLIVILQSCDNNNNNSELVKVTFHNHSSYNIDIYYNFNPQSFDPAAHKGTVDQISRKKDVWVHASTDLLLGDTFYLHFKVPLADRLQTGTIDLFVPAERTMSNISFVVKPGQKYDKVIDDPPHNELRFINGVITVQNQTTSQYWIENHGVILQPLGREAAWLTLGQTAFYEVSLPFLADSWLMDSFRSRDSNVNRTPFPSFEMERGKRYHFIIHNTGISGPTVTNINPLAN